MAMEPSDAVGDLVDDHVYLEDVDVVECDGMDTCSSDDQELPHIAEQIDRFTPPRDDAVAVLQGHNESVFCVAFDPTGTLLASGGQDHVAIVWDVQTKQRVFTAVGHQDSVTQVTFSPNGAYLATGDMAGGIRVWLRPDGASSSDSDQWTLVMSETVGDLLWLRWWQPLSIRNKGIVTNGGSPGPAVLTAGDEDGLVAVWSVSPPNSRTAQSTSQKAKYFAGAGFAATSSTFYLPSIDSDRPKLIVLYRDTVLRLWDLKTEEVLTSVRLVTAHHAEDEMIDEHENSVFCLAQPHLGTEALHQQADLIVVGGMNCILSAVIKSDKQTPSFSSKCLPPIELEDCGSVETVDFSWTHSFFAFGTVSGMMGIVSTTPMRLRQKWSYSANTDEEGNSAGITSLLWSRTSPIFFTSTSDGAVVAWPGLSGAMELVGSASSCPSPLQIWWGHSAMILDLSLCIPPDAPQSSQTNNKEFIVETFIASASDDTTVRIYSTADMVCSA